MVEPVTYMRIILKCGKFAGRESRRETLEGAIVLGLGLLLDLADDVVARSVVEFGASDGGVLRRVLELDDVAVLNHGAGGGSADRRRGSALGEGGRGGSHKGQKRGNDR